MFDQKIFFGIYPCTGDQRITENQSNYRNTHSLSNEITRKMANAYKTTLKVDVWLSDGFEFSSATRPQSFN